MNSDTLRHERDEHITQAEICNRLVQLQDELYMIRRILDRLLEQQRPDPEGSHSRQRQELIAVDYNKRQG